MPGRCFQTKPSWCSRPTSASHLILIYEHSDCSQAVMPCQQTYTILTLNREDITWFSFIRTLIENDNRNNTQKEVDFTDPRAQGIARIKTCKKKPEGVAMLLHHDKKRQEKRQERCQIYSSRSRMLAGVHRLNSVQLL